MAAIAPEPTRASVHSTEMGELPRPQPDNVVASPLPARDGLSPGQGSSEPAVLKLSGEGIEEELPPLTYVDFIPQCLGVRVEGSDPSYAEFLSVVEQANQWLQSTPQFCVVKCETVDHKLHALDSSLNQDDCLQHFSSNGKNVYVKVLRLWLMAKTNPSLPTQQLAYLTVLPDHSSGSLSTLTSALRIHPELLFPQFDTFPQLMEKVNRHLQQKPLPGRILTVELVPFKAVESDSVEEKLNTEHTLWTEGGKNSRLFLYAVRIFYVVGQPTFEKVGYYDQVPDFSQNPEGLGFKIKFAPFSHTVARASQWLQGQENMRVVNIQTVKLKMDRQGAGLFRVNTDTPGYTCALSLVESRYIKILRLFHTRDKKAAEVSALYGATHLTTRLFVPTKTTPWGKSFESFSKTMERAITWLRATGTPVLTMETVNYPVSPENSEDAGVHDERVDVILNSSAGQYSLTCIRLYFPRQFTEPPPEVVAQTQEDSWASWGCVVA